MVFTTKREKAGVKEEKWSLRETLEGLRKYSRVCLHEVTLVCTAMKVLCRVSLKQSRVTNNNVSTTWHG